ncbi:hypothetical protein ONZ45_g6208 [Pleurotus djamor]|nr:hypothetical protein ONZ45_g6208 [Pleurotus djamor]
MATTPHKPGVHWENEPSLSDFGSPFSAASSATEFSPTTVQYLNSQLVAHGFAPSPGLVLEGLSTHDTERLVKCLMGMLGQRMEDMNRTEELSAKYRTLSYDHERLLGMQRTAKEQAANAEREMNVFKSRLAATQKLCKASETAHKQTSAELSRTLTSMQALRQTHQAEIKRKEVQFERMQDRWTKLADAQGQLGKAASGVTFRCGNANLAEGSTSGKGNKSYMEVALEQAEETRARLDADNLRLRRMVVNSVNEMQALLHRVRGEDEDKTEPCTVTSLFPLHPKTAPTDKLLTLMTSLEDAVSTRSDTSLSSLPSSTSHESSQPNLEAEIERLNSIIEKLEAELVQAHKETRSTACKVHELLDELASKRVEDSVDSMSTPDGELQRLESMRRELDEERFKFTEATVKLGRERVDLEAERLKFLEERRSWQVEKALNELPPTPQPSTSTSTAPPAAIPRRPASPHRVKSPRKSPLKLPAKAGSPRKASKLARRSSVGLTPPPKKTKRIPPPSLLLDTFVLPPPSPHAVLPAAPAITLTTSSERLHPIDAMLIDSSHTPTDPPPRSDSEPTLNTPPKHDPFSVLNQPNQSADAPKYSYPVAKPYAKHMIHAYSPVKPSPLSRILMLSDSPGSPEGSGESNGQLGVVMEEDEEEEMFPKLTGIDDGEAMDVVCDGKDGLGGFGHIPESEMSLAAQLGVEESDEDEGVVVVPEKKKKAEGSKPSVKPGKPTSRPPSRTSATTKSSVVTKPSTTRSTKATTSRKVGEEKENTNNNKTVDTTTKSLVKDKKRSSPTGGELERPTKVTKVAGSTSTTSMAKPKSTTPTTSSSSTIKAAATERDAKSTTSTRVTRSKPTSAGVPPSTRGGSTAGGPRRVLLDSAEAPTLAKGRRA